jgi:Transposase DDE domain
LLTVQVHGADIQDRDGAKGVLKRSRARFPFVALAFVDGGYAGRLVAWAKDKAHIVLEVVKRSAEQVGFAVIRRRWVVERTFAWIVKNRRFVRDYEQLTSVAETLITIAATATLIRRWPGPHKPFSNTLSGQRSGICEWGRADAGRARLRGGRG